MTLTEFQTQLLSLTLIEKAEVIQALTQTLSNGSLGITKTPGVMGGDACIANTRLPVWLFVSLRRQGATDAEILQLYPHLTAADLLNVWVYAEAYSEEIEQALKEQEEEIKLRMLG
ncbi:DUF433 domain-containing protein [Planktothrix mougeotii]|uniref:DUF433 domain-containing protein n=1 Tax=Planktothrix mougeotii LEGE 06226 TaxID=1828728 RepID=A0ABR9UAN0_9CYAN|nr:DUF433 domain-containing protein [Planktothrix mougeotii]MBE9143505.1 DUF433 domain-containing protein [Planktothrix mougeotii LEGE 06226]